MASRKEQHQAKLDKLSSFGKTLTRRANSQCELCEAKGVKLRVFQVPPDTNEPSEDNCAFICDVCHEQLQKPKKPDVNHWRCLHSSVWSTVPAVQVLAVWQLSQLLQHDWANDLHEQLYLEAEVKEWLDLLK